MERVAGGATRQPAGVVAQLERYDHKRGGDRGNRKDGHGFFGQQGQGDLYARLPVDLVRQRRLYDSAHRI